MFCGCRICIACKCSSGAHTPPSGAHTRTPSLTHTAAPTHTHTQDNKAVRAVSASLGGIEVHLAGVLVNCDDVGVHFQLGEAPRKEVRGVPHAQQSGHYASFKTTNPDPSTYMSAHLTTMGASEGSMARFVMRFTVKEREWKGDAGDQFLIMKVPGLCRGGDSSPSRNGDFGYVVAMRNSGEKESESVDQAFFEWFHWEITKPFINEVREDKFGQYGWKVGDELVPGMEAVLWYDGAGPQLGAITSEKVLSDCVTHDMTSMKSNPAATAVEQMWDASKCYKQIHHWAKHLNNDNSKPAQNLAARVKEILSSKDVRATVWLDTGRLAALSEFCGKIPEMLQKSCTPQNITEGFKMVGMIGNACAAPDLDQLYSTRKTQTSAEERSLLDENFVEFLKTAQDIGYVPEAHFDAAGFNMDQNPDGSPFSRSKEISQEGQQRAKRLGADFSRQQREQWRARAQRDLNEKAEKDESLVQVNIPPTPLDPHLFCFCCGRHL